MWPRFPQKWHPFPRRVVTFFFRFSPFWLLICSFVAVWISFSFELPFTNTVSSADLEVAPWKPSPQLLLGHWPMVRRWSSVVVPVVSILTFLRLSASWFSSNLLLSISLVSSSFRQFIFSSTCFWTLSCSVIARFSDSNSWSEFLSIDNSVDCSEGFSNSRIFTWAFSIALSFSSCRFSWLSSANLSKRDLYSDSRSLLRSSSSSSMPESNFGSSSLLTSAMKFRWSSSLSLSLSDSVSLKHISDLSFFRLLGHSLRVCPNPLQSIHLSSLRLASGHSLRKCPYPSHSWHCNSFFLEFFVSCLVFWELFRSESFLWNREFDLFPPLSIRLMNLLKFRAISPKFSSIFVTRSCSFESDTKAMLFWEFVVRLDFSRSWTFKIPDNWSNFISSVLTAISSTAL